MISATARKRSTGCSRYSAGFHALNRRSTSMLATAPSAVPMAVASAGASASKTNRPYARAPIAAGKVHRGPQRQPNAKATPKAGHSSRLRACPPDTARASSDKPKVSSPISTARAVAGSLASAEAEGVDTLNFRLEDRRSLPQRCMAWPCPTGRSACRSCRLSSLLAGHAHGEYLSRQARGAASRLPEGAGNRTT